MVDSRTYLCQVLDLLAAHSAGLVVVGSHAVHERTKHLPIVSTATKDSDLALVPELVSDDPNIGQLMRSAGFRPLAEMTENQARGRFAGSPGLWGTGFRGRHPVGEVDLLVPSTLSGNSDEDEARAPESMSVHGPVTTGTVAGIELAVVDRDLLPISSFHDGSVRAAWVAGTAALLCAKAFKICDRVADRDHLGRTHRVVDKDGGDMWRLMAASDPATVAQTLRALEADPTVGAVATEGVVRLRTLFASGEVRTQAQADLGDKTDDVETVYWDWTHDFAAALGPEHL